MCNEHKTLQIHYITPTFSSKLAIKLKKGDSGKNIGQSEATNKIVTIQVKLNFYYKLECRLVYYQDPLRYFDASATNLSNNLCKLCIRELI